MSVESLQAIADAVDLPPDVVRAIVTHSDYPDAMHRFLAPGDPLYGSLGRRLVLACGVDGIRYNMIRPVPHAVNPDRHARIRAKHFSRAHAMLLARTGAEIVGWDGVRHGLLLRGMGADSELRFVIMAGAAGIARRNSAWGCS